MGGRSPTLNPIFLSSSFCFLAWCWPQQPRSQASESRGGVVPGPGHVARACCTENSKQGDWGAARRRQGQRPRVRERASWIRTPCPSSGRLRALTGGSGRGPSDMAQPAMDPPPPGSPHPGDQVWAFLSPASRTLCPPRSTEPCLAPLRGSLGAELRVRFPPSSGQPCPPQLPPPATTSTVPHSPLPSLQCSPPCLCWFSPRPSPCRPA